MQCETVSWHLWSFSTLAVQHERGPRNSAIQKQKRLKKISELCSSQLVTDQTRHIETFTMKLCAAEPHLDIVPFDDCKNMDGYKNSRLIHNPEVFCEMVARLLFKCVGWAKNFSGLFSICLNDQVCWLIKQILLLKQKFCRGNKFRALVLFLNSSGLLFT